MANDQPVKSSSGKVAVGCKLPHGLVIQLERLVEEKGADGSIARKYVPYGAKLKLLGSNSSNVVGGYGITHGVEAAIFDEWLKRNADYQPVREGLIFAQATADAAADQAKEQAAVKNGFEGIDPTKPGRNIEPARN